MMKRFDWWNRNQSTLSTVRSAKASVSRTSGGTGKAARRVAVEHQDSLVPPGLEHGGRQVNAIGITRTAETHVEGGALVGQPQPLVQQAARGGQEVIGRLRYQDQAGNRVSRPVQTVEQPFGGLETEVGGGAPGLDDVPLSDAGHGHDFADLGDPEVLPACQVIDRVPGYAGTHPDNPEAIDTRKTHRPHLSGLLVIDMLVSFSPGNAARTLARRYARPYCRQLAGPLGRAWFTKASSRVRVRAGAFRREVVHRIAAGCAWRRCCCGGT